MKFILSGVRFFSPTTPLLRQRQQEFILALIYQSFKREEGNGFDARAALPRAAALLPRCFSFQFVASAFFFSNTHTM